MRRKPAFPPALALALAGTALPVFALAISYLRIANFAVSLPFAAVAAGLALLFAATTERLMRVEQADGQAGIGSALHATAACCAVAMTLTFSIEGTSLTLAMALSALGAAWVSTVRPLSALRWCAAAFIVIVLARLGRVDMMIDDPARWGLVIVARILGFGAIIGDGLLPVPSWSDIVLRYAIPAVATFQAGVLLRRRKIDLPSTLLDFGALLLGAATATAAVRLGARGAQGALEPDVSLAEAGLYAAFAFAAAALLLRRSAQTTSWVYRRAALFVTGLALVTSAFGPMLIPFIDNSYLGGGMFSNALWPGYAVPALVAAYAALSWRRYGGIFQSARSVRFDILCAIGAFVLGFYFVTLQVTSFFHAAREYPGVWSMAETYGYTIAWLVYGIALLALGMKARAKSIRLASAVVIMLAVAKAFIYDMSELEGIWRALSFIGLGVTLIGIGLVYQRLLFGRKTTTDLELPQG